MHSRVILLLMAAWSSSVTLAGLSNAVLYPNPLSPAELDTLHAAQP